MRLSLLLALLLVLCAAVVLSQESPAGERPPTADSSSVEIDNPEKPSSSDNPEKPADSSSSQDESSEGGNFCIALAMQCPDGSYASQNSECQFICGGAPTGNLNFTYVKDIMAEFDNYYSPLRMISIGTMVGKNLDLRPPEKDTDYCLEVSINANEFRQFPAVYKSVRVFYTKYETPVCSPQFCPDGSMVGCNDICPEDSENSPLLMPFALVFGIVLLSACCCCIRRRRCKKAAACNHTTTQPVSPSHAYPAEYYELLQQEQFVGQTPEALEMPPQIMAQPMLFPPMPPVPPHMLQNGAYPIMIQAPNGVWYMAPPHPEDA